MSVHINQICQSVRLSVYIVHVSLSVHKPKGYGLLILSPTIFLPFSLRLCLSHFLYLSFAYYLSITFCLSLYLPLSPSLPSSLSLFFSLYFKLSPSLSSSLSLSLSFFLSISLSLFLCPSFSLSPLLFLLFYFSNFLISSVFAAPWKDTYAHYVFQRVG